MTKQLNKKGTSLVELIAVIVIMGIIAGIAVPVTIAVINRQKQNAACKSAESLLSTIKNVLTEAAATNDGTLTATAVYGTTNSFTVTAGSTTVDGYGLDDIKMDNFTASGTLAIKYDTAAGTFDYTNANNNTSFKVGNYWIQFSTTGVAKAFKTAPAAQTNNNNG